MKTRKIIAMVACMIPLLVSSFLYPTSAFHHLENITYWNSNGTGNWSVTGFKDYLTAGSYSMSMPDTIDYDNSFSVPGATYGHNDPDMFYVPYAANPEVTIQLFFDPNDPHLAGYAPVIGAPPMTYPFQHDGITPITGIAGTPLPPYTPYLDNIVFMNPADVYCNPYGTQSIEMLDSGRHTHVPEWQFAQWTPGDPVAKGKILPYNVMTFHASAFSDPVNDPDLIYFNKNYSAVKMWINIDPTMIAKAKSLYLAALDPTPANDPWGYFETPFTAGDYLKLGRISLIRDDTGEELVSIGIVADPVTNNFWITQSSQLIADGQATDIATPLPFQNPLAIDPAPDKDIETAKIAAVTDETGVVLHDATSFVYSSGTDIYNIGTDDDAATITNVVYATTHVLDSSYYDINTATSPDTIVLHSADLDFPVANGDAIDVQTDYPERAGLAEFATNTWYQVELSVDYVQNAIFKAYNGDAFLITSHDLVASTTSASFDGNLDVFGVFGSPVSDGVYITPTTPNAILRIDDVKPTYEAMESHESGIVDYLDNLVGKANYVTTIPSANYGNRSINMTFTTTFPSDSDTMFDPWMSDYGIQLVEFADPINTANFIQVLFVPGSISNGMPVQHLKDFGSTITEACFIMMIMDGKKSHDGLPVPAYSRWIGFDVATIPKATSVAVTWNITGGYKMIFTGYADSNPTDVDITLVRTTFSFSGESSFLPGDRLGSGMISYITDAGYGITTRIIKVVVDVNTVLDSPILSKPDLMWHNSTHAMINLAWSSVPGADNYTIYYQNAGKALRSVKNVMSTGKIILVHDQSGSYTFIVTAVNASGESARMNEQIISINLELSAPTITMIDYHVSANLQSATVHVNWSIVGIATGYNVYRSMTNQNETFVLVGSTTDLSLSDTVSETGTYYYKVTTMFGISESEKSKSSNVLVDLNYPGIPSIIILPSTTDTGIVHVKWITTIRTWRYLVYMSNSSSVIVDSAHLVANVSTTGVYYSITSGNGTYYFVVVAVGADHRTSLPSNTASVVVAIPPSAPQSSSLIDQIIKWIQDLWGAIVTFFVSIFGGLLGIALIKNKRTPKGCIGGECTI